VPRSTQIALVRHGIPALLLVVGFAILILEGGDQGVEGWALFTGAALSIWVIGLIVRIGISGDEERSREDEARRYFDEHGRWPDKTR
jgi:hypothetical protein